MKRHQERTSDERGQTLVEFAALLPVLCLLLFGIIQFGVVFHDYLTVTDASRVGARKAAVSRFVGDSGAAAEAAALNAANGLDEDDVTASCEADDWDTAGSDVSCTVTYPYSIDVLGLVVEERHPDERHDRTLGVIMRREHGQAAALTVLFLTVLLASAAAVIDVGSWFREDRDTQRVADAAALAGAQALPESQGTARALAIEYGGKNGGGVAAANVSFSTTALAGDTIKVSVEKPADSFFAKIVGIDSVEVGSTAKARAGVSERGTLGRADRRRREAPVAQLPPDAVVLRRERTRPRSTSRRSGPAHSACSTSMARTAEPAPRSSRNGFSRVTTARCRSDSTTRTPEPSTTHRKSRAQ